MNLPSAPTVRCGALILGVAFVVAGCSSTPRTTDASGLKIIEPKIVTTEYQYVTPTGSNIPVRVPKRGSALASSTGIQQMDPEAFREIVTRGNSGRR